MLASALIHTTLGGVTVERTTGLLVAGVVLLSLGDGADADSLPQRVTALEEQAAEQAQAVQNLDERVGGVEGDVNELDQRL